MNNFSTKSEDTAKSPPPLFRPTTGTIMD